LNSENGNIVLRVDGSKVYKYFEKESGKHVVQRRPKNGKGKAHTSIVSVVVLPLYPENKLSGLPKSEIEIIAQCGHGPGGQHQNKSATSIRAKHIPTGESVFIVGRSRYHNECEALKILTAKVTNKAYQDSVDSYNQLKKNTSAGFSRGGKIRVYNFMENRIVDTRTGAKFKNLDEIFKKGKFDIFYCE